MRAALGLAGIRSLEELKRVNLWVFMNQNALYSIGKRQEVFSALKRTLNADKVSPERQSTSLTCFADYLHTKSLSVNYNGVKTPIEPPEKPPAEAGSEPGLAAQEEARVLAADLEGITVNELYAQLPGGGTKQALRKAWDGSPKLVEIAEHLIHVDAFTDWAEGAQKLEDILEKMLARNSGYVSDAQLYDFAWVEMGMFLNDNGMQEARKVFNLAQHPFEETKYP